MAKNLSSALRSRPVASRINPFEKSTHGWYLVPPVEWLAPLTADQKAAIPVGPKGEGVVITDEGEVWFRLAKKDSCWVNAANECRKPESSPEAYADWQGFPKQFRGADGALVTEHIGTVAFDTGHAPEGNLSWRQVVDHYMNEVRHGKAGRWSRRALDAPTTAFAHGRIHIDAESDGSIWFHGAVAAHRTMVEVLLGASSGSSGEWMRRMRGGVRNLAGICLVISPAYRSSHRMAASSTLEADVDPDRFVTFGEGWSSSLGDMLDAIDDNEFWDFADRVAASIETDLGSDVPVESAEPPEGGDAPAELAGNAPADDPAALAISSGVKFHAASPGNFDDGGDGGDDEGDDAAPDPSEAAQKLGQQLGKKMSAALAESGDWRLASTVPVEIPETMVFEVYAMCGGVRSGDGRIIMKDACEMPHPGMPLMWEREGMSHDNQVLVGWLWKLERRQRDDGFIDVVLLGTWAPTPEAKELASLKPVDGSARLGLQVSIDGGAPQYGVVWDEINHPQVMPLVDNGKYLGSYSAPYYVFSKLEIAGTSVVGTPAIAQTAVRELASVEPEFATDRVAASIAFGGLRLGIARMMKDDLPGQPGSGLPLPLRWYTSDVRSVHASRVSALARRLRAV